MTPTIPDEAVEAAARALQEWTEGDGIVFRLSDKTKREVATRMLTAAAPMMVSQERKALLLLFSMMRQHMLDEFGKVTRTGCFDVVCRALDGEPLLPPLPAEGGE